MNGTKKSINVPDGNVLACNRSGFLLMELLFAFVVLVALATVVAHYQVHSVYLAQESHRQAEALAMLMNAINEYKISGKVSETCSDSKNIRITFRPIPVQAGLIYQDKPVFHLVECIVEWQGMTRMQSMKITISERYA